MSLLSRLASNPRTPTWVLNMILRWGYDLRVWRLVAANPNAAPEWLTKEILHKDVEASWNAACNPSTALPAQGYDTDELEDTLSRWRCYKPGVTPIFLDRLFTSSSYWHLNNTITVLKNIAVSPYAAEYLYRRHRNLPYGIQSWFVLTTLLSGPSSSEMPFWIAVELTHHDDMGIRNRALDVIERRGLLGLMQ